MKKFIYKLIAYIVVLFILLNIMSLGVFAVHRNASLFKPSFVVNNLDSTSKFDYIVLGSSIGLMGVNTHIIDSICMTNGVNLAMEGSGFHTNYAMLRLFLDQGCKTSTVILSLDVCRPSLLYDEFRNSDFQFIPFFNRQQVYNIYRNHEKNIKSSSLMSMSRYLPIVSVAYYNAQMFYSALLAIKDLDKRHNFDKKGNYSYPNTHIAKSNKQELEIEDVNLKNISVLAIENICKDNNIELIYYLAPKYNCTSVLDHRSSKDRKFVNFRDIFNDKEEFFYDIVHVNKSGRDEASTRLAVELTNIYR